jgi:predicted Fe-S protein YdhL (DUF1289 family)
MLSPCVRLCSLDPATRFCVGCGRSIEEIGHWLTYSDAERRAIMAALPARLAGLGKPQAPAADGVRA